MLSALAVDQDLVAAELRALQRGQPHGVTTVLVDRERQCQPGTDLAVGPGQKRPGAEEPLCLHGRLDQSPGDLGLAERADQKVLLPGHARSGQGGNGSRPFRLAGLVPEGHAAEEIGAFEVEAVEVVFIVPLVLDRDPERLLEIDRVETCQR